MADKGPKLSGNIPCAPWGESRFA